MYLRSKHRVQTRYFDRISTRNATLFRLAVETVLFGILACFSFMDIVIGVFLLKFWKKLRQGLHKEIPAALLMI